ncbi:ATP-binding protein [Actinokineospora auranticolor]|uniref:NACHT N-terminal Helical domain-containing protein n=1 Tax=Actinokineospora auranticolor TaxID=155976 RepID=A0A2S6GQK9_9PSEU|nr:ATP-binding protein [Actinokineospora auranticolor]PPK67480.1 hypothetical protein CLV40_107144 [Actinokineospora auranticolor]
MSKDPALTYEGALRILGRHEPKGLKAVDLALGVGIIGAGVASLFAPAAAAALFASVWSWVDQKNEAMGLVRAAIDKVSGRAKNLNGVERRELILAAHSTLVVTSYFEALRESLGEERFKALELTDAEMRALAEPSARVLYQAEIPVPSASAGFVENQGRVEDWLTALDFRVREFIDGLAVNEHTHHRLYKSVVVRAGVRYQSHYLRLAATVPEFLAWASFGEHAATRSSIRDLRADFEIALIGQTDALARIESMLALSAPADPAGDARATVHTGNRAELREQIIPESAAAKYGSFVVFPTVDRLFVNPRYRFAVYGPDAQPSAEKWWGDREVQHDLDLRLVAHLTSAEAARRPLLILGHPGAGKSLLTKVLAARLSTPSYTVVRVPLRHVGGDLPVYDQIQQALSRSTHARVEWKDLDAQSLDTVRVVLLDGLDELVHQTHTRLNGYLHAVAEFQRCEADLGRPVAVVVTSRTVVADRVEIPNNTPIIKLESFDEDQIAAWLRVWHEANAMEIARDTVGMVPLELALAHQDLTGQPLLLLMMALYVADPLAPGLDGELAPVDLYERLLRHFAEREATKSPTGLAAREVAKRVDDHLDRLAIVALAMFNRGRQDITAEELHADIAALEKTKDLPIDTGQRVLGEFFFVHTSEARFGSTESPQRRHEFLHATFSEYLVANRVVEELVDVMRVASAGRRGMRKPDDDLLFALLSHEVLQSRANIVGFARDLLARLDETDRILVADVLGALIAEYRDRHGSDEYQDYRPRSADQVRALAAYSANLVLLCIALEPDGVRLAALWPDQADPLVPWRAMLSLWRAGLAPESWLVMLAALHNEGGVVHATSDYLVSEAINHADLAGDLHTHQLLRLGGELFSDYARRDARGGFRSVGLATEMVVSLVRQRPVALSRADTGALRLGGDDPPVDLGMLVQRTLVSGALVQTFESVVEMVRYLFLVRPGEYIDRYALAASLLAHPRILSKIPDVENQLLDVADRGILLMLRLGNSSLEEDEQELIDQVRAKYEARWGVAEAVIDERTLKAMRSVLDAHRWPRRPESRDLP